MAKHWEVSYHGASALFTLSKITRANLYGTRKRFPVDAHGRGWADVLRDLEALTEAEVEQDDKLYALRSEARGTCGRVFRATGVAFPPSVRRLAGDAERV